VGGKIRIFQLGKGVFLTENDATNQKPPAFNWSRRSLFLSDAVSRAGSAEAVFAVAGGRSGTGR